MVCHVSTYEDYYVWEECEDGHSCLLIIHDDSSAETMNNYPRKWVESLLGFTVEQQPHRLLKIFFADEKGLKHRVDGPACQTSDYIGWYQHDGLHRLDGPAFEDGDSKEWWVDGKRHRLEGPAVESEETHEWWVNNLMHRVDGPAMVDHRHNERKWYRDGKLHRLDGPAVETGDGADEWWVNGVHRKNEGPALFGVERVWFCRGLKWNEEDMLVSYDGLTI